MRIEIKFQTKVQDLPNKIDLTRIGVIVGTNETGDKVAIEPYDELEVVAYASGIEAALRAVGVWVDVEAVLPDRTNERRHGS